MSIAFDITCEFHYFNTEQYTTISKFDWNANYQQYLDKIYVRLEDLLIEDDSISDEEYESTCNCIREQISNFRDNVNDFISKVFDKPNIDKPKIENDYFVHKAFGISHEDLKNAIYTLYIKNQGFFIVRMISHDFTKKKFNQWIKFNAGDTRPGFIIKDGHRVFDARYDNYDILE